MSRWHVADKRMQVLIDCIEDEREAALFAAFAARWQGCWIGVGLAAALEEIADGDGRCSAKYGPGCDGECQHAAWRAIQEAQ